MSADQDKAPSFREWFHAEYLREFGPVDPESDFSRKHHRELKGWCENAWLHGRSSAFTDSEGV